MNSFLRPIVIVIVILLAVFAYARFGPGLPINVVSTQKLDLFSVSGEGKVTAIPDSAKVTVGITQSGQNLGEVQGQVNGVINKLTDDLVKLGIKRENIKTTNYNINPDYDYTSSPPTSRGFTVSASQEITVENLELLGQVIDTAVADGANIVGGVTFKVNEKKRKELMQEARKLAAQDAKEKANQLAEAAGITLGKVIDAQEQENFGRPIPYALDAQAVERSTQLEPGTSEIISTITLTFETR